MNFETARTRFLRACLDGGGGPQVGEVNRLSIKSLILIWSHLHDRSGDPPSVTSPIWVPHLHLNRKKVTFFAAVAVPARRLHRRSRSMQSETNPLRPSDSKCIGRAESLGLGTRQCLSIMLPTMQFVFPDCLGSVPEASAYKCFIFNWFDFHWGKKEENAISFGSGCLRSSLDDRHVSAFVSLAPPPPCRKIISLCIMKLLTYAFSSRLSTMYSLHSMITLGYNIRFLIIDEMSQSKIGNHWKVHNFPSEDNCRQIRIQDTQRG